MTLFATELLSNATVAVLFTPIAVSLAEAFGVSARPFLVAVMIAASAAFATPFGYQTNVIVYQMGGYNYLDFVKVGIPAEPDHLGRGNRRDPGVFSVLGRSVGLLRHPDQRRPQQPVLHHVARLQLLDDRPGLRLGVRQLDHRLVPVRDRAFRPSAWMRVTPWRVSAASSSRPVASIPARNWLATLSSRSSSLTAASARSR